MTSTYTGPNAPYGQPRDNGWTWNPGAGDLYSQQNGFDPTTGAPVGPGSLPPHTIALGWQAEHERRVWQYQQSLMRSAHGYASGALGLLQSFRPGGSAAIEAGQYNTLANVQLQRAGMTRPLDLTADYQREQNFQNQRRANRQAERQLYVQGAAAIASIAGAAFTGGASLAMLPGLMSGVAGMATGPTYQQNSYEAGRQPVGPDQSTWQTRPTTSAPTGPAGPASTGPAGQSGGQAGPAGPSLMPQGQQGSSGSAGSGQALGSTLAPDQGAGGQPGGSGGPQGGQDGAPGGGFGGQGAPAVGADGNFMPVAYAARGAMAAGGDPLRHLAMSSMVASELEGDPIYMRFALGVDARLKARLEAMAAA